MTAPLLRLPVLGDQVRPYTAAAVHRGVVYTCGQVPVDADGHTPATIGEQVTACLDNLEVTLLRAGSNLGHVLQVTAYLADLGELDAYNVAYLARFPASCLPPRTTIEVAAFRGDKRIEISAIAAVVAAAPPPVSSLQERSS